MFNTVENNSHASTISGGVVNHIGNDAGHSTIGGGFSNSVASQAATIPGGFGARANNYAQFAYAGGMFGFPGDAQMSFFVASGITTNGATNTLLLGNSSPIRISDGSTWAFDILVVGRTVGGVSVGFQIRGVIENTGGITALVGSPIVTILASGTGWAAGVTADDTNDALAISVNGEDGTTIRWVASVRTVEVGF